MRERALMAETRGWGRSVHDLQRLPAAAPRNTDQTMDAILSATSATAQSGQAA
jgi:dihydroorotase